MENVESLDEDGRVEEDEFRPRQVRAWQDDPEQLYSQAETRELVEKAVMRLRPKYRVVVMLRDIEQLSTEEAAQTLGLSVPALKARLFRGRLMLREWLSKYFTEPGEGGKSVITCDQFMAELEDYLEGQSAVEVRQQLESHLSHCRICQVIYDFWCKTVKIVTETGSFDLPQDVSEAITEKIMAKLRPEGGKPLSKKPGS
jgi:predicted DNA-binding protein (UPF0251 family)